MKNRPTIAMLGQIGGGLFSNGVPVFLNMVSIVCRRFDVAFYSLMIVNAHEQKKGLTIHSISKRKLPLRLKYALLLTSLILDHIRNPFDVIYAVSAFPAGRMAIVLGWILRRPVIIQLIVDEMVSMPEIDYGQLLNPKFRKVNKWVCRNASELVVLSQYQKDIVLQNMDTPRRIRVMPLRIDVNRFPYQQHILSSPIEFVHVAYFHRVKDQKTLFQAFDQIAKVINCTLTVVGDGFQVPEVTQLLDELSIKNNVRFVGTIMNDKLQYIFSNKHILLHTSRYEAECAVVMEAMASGLVVCGTSVGLLADHGSHLAVVVPPASPSALAEAVLKLLGDPERYRSLQINARKYIEEFSSEWSGQEYLKLFNYWTTDYSKAK